MLDKLLLLLGLQRIPPPFGVSTEITNAGVKCKSSIRTSADGLLHLESDRIIIRDAPTPSKPFVHDGSELGYGRLIIPPIPLN